MEAAAAVAAACREVLCRLLFDTVLLILFSVLLLLFVVFVLLMSGHTLVHDVYEEAKRRS